MRRRRKMRSAGTTTSSQLSRKKKIVIRVITTIPCHERIHDIKKKKKKISFIVVPRRRENFSFPTFPSSSFFFLLFLNCKIEKISLDLVARISLFFYPIRSSMDGRNEDRGLFFFFFFFVIDTVLLVKIRCVHSNEREKRILRQDTDLDRKRTIDPKIFLLDQSPLFSSSMPFPVAEFLRPRGAIILPSLCIVYVSISFRTSGKPTNRVTLI